MKFAYHDYEFNQTSEPSLNLVSCCLRYNKVNHNEWLHNHEQGKIALREMYKKLKAEKVILVAFNAESEARAMIDLGVDPLDFEWIDLYLEFKMLMNHNNEIAYGEHYVNKMVRKLSPFKDAKPNPSLATALYKFCKVKVDTAHKDEMRSLIISNPESFTVEQRESILKYGESDVEHLPSLFKSMWEYYEKKLDKRGFSLLLDEAKRRARYAVRTAYMVKRGYPINLEWTRNLSGSTGALMDSCIRDIVGQFKGKENFQPFYWNRKECRWSMDQKNIRAWIRSQGLDKGWELTDGGADKSKRDLALKAECFEDRFNYRHTFPRGNYGAQMVRYFKLKQSLNGFTEKAGAANKSFWEYVGTDNRVRSFFNIYGAQSGRSQPASTAYIPLKPAWQRSLIQPPPGKMIVGCDYSSQEFLLSALFSKDKKMLEAYRSGDVYLAFGKEIKLIPKDGTKAQYKMERDACKATVLGLSYLMSKFGLSKKLTADTGKVWTEDDAQEMVEKFQNAYLTFDDFRRETIASYYDRGGIKLKDGWMMFADNRNERSVGNMPIQGSGSDIMRRAVELCEDDGIEVILTLHDALYVEVNHGDWDAVRRFNRAMKTAFIDYFPKEQANDASMIRTDLYGWGPGFSEDSEIEIPECGKVFFSEIYIDERAASEFDKFKNFFMSTPGADVL